MPRTIKVCELYETDGGGMGRHVRTFGWYANHEDAERGGRNHAMCSIRDDVSALVLDNGRVHSS
jgi:hypothetical protein